MHISKHQTIRSVMMAELRKSALRNTYKQNSEIKTDQQQVGKKFVLFRKCIIFAITCWIRAKEG